MSDEPTREQDQQGPVQPGLDTATEEEALHVAMVAYAKAASARETVERQISLAATAASSIVTLSIFASLAASPSLTAKVMTGILSAAAAALTALDKLSASAPSTALLKRAGEFARLRYQLLLGGQPALPTVGAEHAELIGAPPSADDKYWTKARTQVGAHEPGA